MQRTGIRFTTKLFIALVFALLRFMLLTGKYNFQKLWLYGALMDTTQPHYFKYAAQRRLTKHLLRNGQLMVAMPAIHALGF